MNIPRVVFFGIASMVPLSAQTTSASFTPSNIAGAAYSATLITQRTEINGDGTQMTIPAEEMRMYRDSAGRTRIESDIHECGMSACSVTIIDPLGGFRYQINSHSRVVERIAIPGSRPPVLGPESDMIGPVGVISNRPIVDGAVRGIGMAGDHFRNESQFLGTRTIEGVAAQGGRIVTTLEAGVAGNDHEVAVTNERWVATDLRVLVVSQLLDPRYGNRLSRLTHVSLTEPDPALFAPPVDYTIKDMPKSDQ